MKTPKKSIRRRIFSLLLLVVFMSSQIFSLNIYGTTSENISCTISPSSVDLTSSQKRISVVAVSGEPFTAGNVTVGLFDSAGNRATASITNVSSTATKVDFTVGKGLATGVYTIKVSDFVKDMLYTCGTLNVGTATVKSVSPSSLANGFTENTIVTITGENTNFKAGSTTIEIIDSITGVTARTPSGINVSSATSLSFTLKGGLASGVYNVKATTQVNTSITENAVGSSILTVRGTSGISLSSSKLKSGYSATSLTVTGTNTGFVDGTTSVSIITDSDGDGVIDEGELATGKAGTPSVLSSTSLTFSVNTGLNSGKYIVKIKTGEEIATTKLEIGAATGMVTDSNGNEFASVSQGYSSTQNLKFVGTNSSFQEGTTTLSLFNEAEENITSTYITSTLVSSTTNISFTLNKGLTAGTYTVKVATGTQTITDTFVINPISISEIAYNSSVVETGTNKIPVGYKAFQATATGVNTSFGESTTVKVLNSSDVEVASAVSSKVVSSTTEIAFNIAANLTAGTYKFQIDTDGTTTTPNTDVVEQTFEVVTPTITSVLPSSVVQSSSPVSVTIIGTNTKFLGTTPTIDFTSITGETITSISVSELDDSADTEKIEFAFTPSSTLFSKASHTFTISLNNSAISTTVTGSISVTDKGISVSPSTIYSNKLGTRLVTITGIGSTNFSTNTEVYLDYGLNTQQLLTMTIPTTSSMSFTIPAGLTSGVHTLKVIEDKTSQSTEVYDSNLLVVTRAISLSPTSAIEGYTSYDVTIDAVGLTFSPSNKPTITIVDESSNEESITWSDSYIVSQKKLTFPFPISKDSGTYTVKLAWSSGDYSGLEMTKMCYIAPGAPVANIKGGTYNIDKNVLLTLDSKAATTFYTLDGTEPTNASTAYTPESTIEISGTDGTTVVLKAVSYNSNGNIGAVVTEMYIFDKSGPEDPTVDVDSGTYNKAKEVTITPNVEAATTYYTTDGTAPSSTNGTSYTSGTIRIDGANGDSVTLKIISYDTLENVSSIVTKAYKFDKVGPSKPTVDIPSGTYKTAQDVTLTTAGDSSNTYYTLDGTEPTNASTAYVSGTIAISGDNKTTKTLKAVSYDSLGNIGEVLTQEYYFNSDPLLAPSASVNSGLYNQNLSISITPPPNANSTYYTLNGEEPTNSILVEGNYMYSIGTPITITAQDGLLVTLKVVSFESDGAKGIPLTKIYEFDTSGPASPTTNVDTSTINSTQNISVIPATGAVSTYYTIDGTEPTNQSTLYVLDSTIEISGSNGDVKVIKAVSYDTLGNIGEIMTKTYTFDMIGPDVASLSPIAGTYTGTQNVTIIPSTGNENSINDAVNTYYTLDGTDPTNASTEFTGTPVEIAGNNGETKTIKVVSYDSLGNIGSVLSADYFFNTNPIAAPTATVHDGEYTVNLSVIIEPNEAAIGTYYTIDGTEPTDQSTSYTAGTSISIPYVGGETVVLKAVSYDANGRGLDMVKTYQFTGQASPSPTQSSTPTATPTTAPVGGGGSSGGGTVITTTAPPSGTPTSTATTSPTATPKPTTTAALKTSKPELEFSLVDKVEKVVEGTKTKLEITKESVLETIDSIEDGKEVDLVLTLPEVETDSQEITINKDLMEAVSAKKSDISLKSEDTEMKIPAEIIEEYKGSDFEVNIKKLNIIEEGEIAGNLEKNENKGKSKIGTIIDFTFNVVDGDEKTPVTEFKNPIKISIKLSEDNVVKFDVKKLGIYYMDEETGIWNYAGGKYNSETGKMETSTNHFTKFTIMEYSIVFNDVKDDFWAKDYIDTLVSRHIVNGMTEDTFVPSGNITRAQFAKLITTAFNLEMGDYESTFSDVAETAWYSPYVEAVAREGIVSGMGDGTYSPDSNITREQMAKMIMNAYEFKSGESADEIADGMNNPFTDFDSVSVWAQSSIQAAYKLGIINGMTPTEFTPKGTAQRSQAAKVIYVMLEQLGEL